MKDYYSRDHDQYNHEPLPDDDGMDYRALDAQFSI